MLSSVSNLGFSLHHDLFQNLWHNFPASLIVDRTACEQHPDKFQPKTINMQDPSTKKDEAVQARATGITEPVNQQVVAPLTDDMEEKDPDYLFHDLDGGEG